MNEIQLILTAAFVLVTIFGFGFFVGILTGMFIERHRKKEGGGPL